MTPTLIWMMGVDPEDSAHASGRIWSVPVFGEARIPSSKPVSTKPHHVAANHDVGFQLSELQPELFFVRFEGGRELVPTSGRAPSRLLDINDGHVAERRREF